MSRVSLIIAGAALAGAACSNEAAPDKTDASRPAVVKGPPVVLPADTARPDTLLTHMERIERAKRELAGQYALLGAGGVMGDGRLVTEFYTPQALLRIGDSVYVGQVSIAEGLMRFLRRNDIYVMTRASSKIEFSGGVYRDSGQYSLKAKRPGSAGVEEVGPYVSEWIRAGIPERWVLQKDYLARTRPRR